MKKTLLILGAIAIVLVLAVPTVMNYINNRYVGNTYYFVAPSAPEQTYEKNSDDKEIETNGKKTPIYDYKNVTVYDEKTAEKRTVDMTWRSETPMVEGNVYKAEISKTIVVKGPNAVSDTSSLSKDLKEKLGLN